MDKIIINTPLARSEILVGEQWESVNRMLPEHGVVIITDENVLGIYGDRFPRFPVFKVEAGETSKKLEVVEQLAEKLLAAGIDRTGFILAIGGGVVCDIAGFLASVYMRGIRCAYISSTLLSQVDASTGGKTGINLGNTKNILGSFRQPEFVICDPVMLHTLPEEEFLSGLSELIKTAIIGNERLFEMIEHNYDGIEARDTELLSLMIGMSVNFKASVVSEDEKESGLRRILNFGHTYGHAIEMHNSLKHGFAVASGMELATTFSFSKGLITESERRRIVDLLKKYKLLREHNIPDDQIGQFILHDKKKTGTDLHFVFINGIGKALVEKIPVGEVIRFYKQYNSGKQII